MPELMSVNNLCKYFSGGAALEKICFSLEEGSVCGLIGANGAGKSTLLRILAGIYRPDAGSVSMLGMNPYDAPEVRGGSFFIPDYPWFPQGATLCSAAAYYRVLYPNWDDSLFDALCAAFPVGNVRGKLSSLSKGMQRQAALALALSTRPKLLLLDEIFDGLDPVVRCLARQALMDAVTQRGASILLASNSLRELEEICDSIVLLYQGKMILKQPADVMRESVTRIQAAFDAPVERVDFKGLEILSFQARGRMVTLAVRGERSRIVAQIQAMRPVFLEASPSTLEEAFISEMEGAGYEIPNA